MQNQREEKMLENNIDVLVTQLNDLKSKLQALLFKIEHENAEFFWPTALENLALISSHFAAVSKILHSEKSQALRNLTILPLTLSQDNDEELMKMTENRISTFSHDLAPNYLRTKCEPEIDQKINQFVHKANSVNQDTGTKQLTAFNKVVNNVVETINKFKEDWETEAGNRGGVVQTTIEQDTHNLVSAISIGKDLKNISSQGMPPGPGSMHLNPGVRPGMPGGPPGSGGVSSMNSNQPPIGMINKNQVRTNIKSAITSFR